MSSDERAPLLDPERGGARPVGWRSRLGFGLAVATTLAAFAAALIRALLVPGVGLGETEDAAVVALALEAAESRLERLVGTDGDLDQRTGWWCGR